MVLVIWWVGYERDVICYVVNVIDRLLSLLK